MPSAVDGFPRNGRVAEDWADDRGPLDLMSAAAWLGALVWTERELHGVVGGWVGDAVDPGAAVLFDRLAMAHAARADVLFARLPELRELPPAVVVVEPGPATATVVARLAEQTSDHERAAAWVEVGRGLLAGYEDLLRRSSPVTDAPLRRRLPALIEGLAADVVDCGAAVGGSAGATGGLDASPVAELVAATASFTA